MRKRRLMTWLILGQAKHKHKGWTLSLWESRGKRIDNQHKETECFSRTNQRRACGCERIHKPSIIEGDRI